METNVCADLDALCRSGVSAGAADILFHEGRSPVVRVGSGLRELSSAPLDGAFFDNLWEQLRFAPTMFDLDAALELEDGQRFRVSAFRQLGRRAAVLRVVKRDVPTLDSLRLPSDVLRSWLARTAGLILVTGPTNSGKSTTLASCIAEILSGASRHVVTVEDPIEYVFQSARSVVTQREVGIDVASFPEALRQTLRQSPDVIFIGEIRDPESAMTALQATETGHLVLATVHGNRVTDALERMIQLLPDNLRPVMTRAIAGNLLGVMAQKLVSTPTGTRIPSVEYFTNVGAVRPMIEQGRMSDLRSHLDRADDRDGRSENRALLALCKAGHISDTEAMRISDTPSDLGLLLKGISQRGR